LATTVDRVEPSRSDDEPASGTAAAAKTNTTLAASERAKLQT
jgi:hypothetical protein